MSSMRSANSSAIRTSSSQDLRLANGDCGVDAGASLARRARHRRACLVGVGRYQPCGRARRPRRPACRCSASRSSRQCCTRRRLGLLARA
jgi:hypothetical protein